MTSSRETAIVIPAYNAERYVQAAIDSALAQDADNILVVDDGSSDDTSKIVASYAELGSRLHLHRQLNTGLAGARNAGLRLTSRQRYVMFLDADDVLLPGALAALASAQSKSGAVAVGGRARYLSEDGSRVRGLTAQVPRPLDQSAVLAGRLAPWPPSAALIVREAALEAGGFNIAMSKCSGFPEDLDFWSRLAQLGELELIDHEVLLYRVRKTSISAATDIDLIRGTAFLEQMISVGNTSFGCDDFRRFLAEAQPLRRREKARIHYRRAGEAYVNARHISALVSLARGAIHSPSYVALRAWRQTRRNG